MFPEFEEHLRTSFSYLENQVIAVACSGGLDSMVLADLFIRAGYRVCLVHCNFMLRNQESEQDAQLVRDFAAQHHLPVYIKRFYTQQYAQYSGLNTQLAARTLRYNWFEELVLRKSAAYVATAHHLDDNLETFMINLSRGTGLKGLLGIPAESQFVVRPLLPFSREAILAYAKKNKIPWREDQSNQTTAYLRNKLRLEVIPTWKKQVPQLLQQLQKTLHHLHQSQQLIDDYSALLYSYLVEETPDGIQVDIPKLKKLPHNQAVLYELIHPFGFTAWEDIYGLLEAPSGKKIFSKNYTLLKDRTLLMIQKNRPLESGIYKIHPQQKEINEPIRLQFTYINDCENVKENIIFVDQQKLKYPLHLRKWQEGDYFYPLGLAGKKKLSKFFKDEKLSLFAKQKIWLLCDADDHIVWVIGYRMDHRYKISDSTKTKVKIELIQ